MSQFASNKRALGICDRCGFRYKLRQLRELTVKDRHTKLKVCPTCWEPDHPQLKLGSFPIYDPQALHDARPDSAELAASRAILVPIRIGVGAIGKLGVYEVSVS